jgi:hypothetical protein
VNHWGAMFGLAGTAARDFGAILRRRWWLVLGVAALGLVCYFAIDRAGGNLLLTSLPALALLLFGTCWIFADVMRLRWPDYKLDGEQFGQLVPLSIGMGIAAAVVDIPGFFLIHADMMVQSQILDFILMLLLFTKFAFVFYASEESQQFGDAFGISWRATSGAAFLPTLVIVALSMLPGQLLGIFDRVVGSSPYITYGVSMAMQLLIMSFFSPWKIRWMGVLLDRTTDEPSLREANELA